MKNLRPLATLILLSVSGLLSAENKPTEKTEKTETNKEEQISKSFENEKDHIQSIPMPANKSAGSLSKNRWEDSLLDENLGVNLPKFVSDNSENLFRGNNIVANLKK
ncbi:MAG: hypothetical protein RLQ12_01365 [Cyclobacteriaceae bacterium]